MLTADEARDIYNHSINSALNKACLQIHEDVKSQAKAGRRTLNISFVLEGCGKEVKDNVLSSLTNQGFKYHNEGLGSDLISW